MRRVLPGCMYGWIPKVQGALDVHFVSPVPSCLGAECAFHQKDTVSRGEQTVRQSARRAVKSQIPCSAFVTRCIVPGVDRGATAQSVAITNAAPASCEMSSTSAGWSGTDSAI